MDKMKGIQHGRQVNPCHIAAQIAKYQKRPEVSREERQAREEAAYMRIALATTAFLGIVEAADWLLRIFL